MKTMITWHERPHGSAADYEDAQKRILGVFQHWQWPESVKVLQFLVRAGEWGGFLLVETDDLLSLHRLASIFPAFEFRLYPVIDIQEAVAAELEAISWRDALPA